MPDDLSQDLFATKSKRSPVLLRTVVLAFSTFIGVYICFICLKQINTSADGKYIMPFSNVQVNERDCHLSGDQVKRMFLHFPKPNTYSRGECNCNPVHFFAILSMQRSGSGWFETFLNSHLNVSSNGEIFSVKERRNNASAILTTLDKVYNLDWYSSAAKNECSGAVGFKWMLNQGVMRYHMDIVDYFKSRGVSAIFLLRKNILRRMVSVLANTYDRDTKQLNGTHKSHVHSKTEANVLAQYKPTINVTLLLPELRRVENLTTSALQYFNSTRHIIFYYEDLVNNHTKLIEVQEFLKVPVRRLNSKQVRIHTKPLSRQISNWSEVYKTLKGTKYEYFLEDA